MTPASPGLGPSLLPLSRQSDEDLIFLSRAHEAGAFEELVGRYRAELLRFCRRMMKSKEDAEDVLQEVFTSAYFAMLADERPIVCGPWLYRIARNRCLNKLRRGSAAQHVTIDDEENGYHAEYASDGGASTADKAQLNAEFRTLVHDLLELPDGQRAALVLYEMEGCSYEQIAHTMKQTVPSVRSLLLRARTNLIEASAARTVSCAEIRAELQAGPGRTKSPSAHARRHLKECKACASFNKARRRRALYLFLPFGPGAAGSLWSGSGTAVGVGSAGAGALAAKAAAGLAVLALAGAGAAEIQHALARPGASSPHASSRAPAVPTRPGIVPNYRPIRVPIAAPKAVRAGLPRDGQKARTGQAHTPSIGQLPSTRQRAVTTGAVDSSAATSEPLITRRMRPGPGSGSTTERTRPTPQSIVPGSTGSGGSTSASSSASSSSQPSASGSAAGTQAGAASSSTASTSSAASSPSSSSGASGSDQADSTSGGGSSAQTGTGATSSTGAGSASGS